MKITKKISFLALAAGALSLSHSSAFGQPFDSATVLHNRAVAASPRAREAFPWLDRPAGKSSSSWHTVPSRAAFIHTTSTTGWPSPRTLEEFPELLRPALPLEKSGANFVAGPSRNNRAWLTSPRGLEEFPLLFRRDWISTNERFQMAPLK